MKRSSVNSGKWPVMGFAIQAAVWLEFPVLPLCSGPCATLKDNYNQQNNILQSTDPSKRSSNWINCLSWTGNFIKQVPCGFVKRFFFWSLDGYCCAVAGLIISYRVFQNFYFSTETLSRIHSILCFCHRSYLLYQRQHINEMRIAIGRKG